MRWSDERYVRLYTRDTIAWRCLPWQARALFPLVLRKLDRAGLMPLDGHGAAGLAVLVDLPVEVVEVGYPALLKDGCLRESDGMIVCPNFLEAQEAAQSGPHRSREHRAREREIAAAQARSQENDTKRAADDTKRAATDTSGNSATQSDTERHSVPCRAVPCRTHSNALPASPAFDLDALYALYPGTKGKAKGMAKLRAEIKTQADYDRVKAGIEAYAAECVSARTEPRFVAHFSTWVNGKRWEDYEAGGKAAPVEPECFRPWKPLESLS